MTSVEFDFSELRAFKVDLDDIPAKSDRLFREAVRISAHRGRGAWKQEASGHKFLKKYPKEITADPVKSAGGVISSEIGPELGGQGSLGIVEDAPGGVRGRAQRNYRAAERRIEEDLPRGIAVAIDQAWGRA